MTLPGHISIIITYIIFNHGCKLDLRTKVYIVIKKILIFQCHVKWWLNECDSAPCITIINPKLKNIKMWN